MAKHQPRGTAPGQSPAQSRKRNHRKGGSAGAGAAEMPANPGPETDGAAGTPPKTVKTARGGNSPRKTEEAERRCIVSGEVFPKSRLLRFVAGPSGEVVLDLDGKLPGRGLWLSMRRDMVETAARKKAFARAARMGLTAPPDLADQVASLLRRRCLDRLGFARRAGLVTAGFDKVKAEAKAGRVRLLLEASEGAADGRRKLSALVPQAPVVDLFSGAELAAILGRDHVVHVALLAGPPAQRPLAERLKFEIDRLREYLGLSADSEGATSVAVEAQDSDRRDSASATPPGRTEPTEQVQAQAGLQGPSEHTDFDA